MSDSLFTRFNKEEKSWSMESRAHRAALQVVYCSSWEDKHPPVALEEVGPFTKGWQSERYCHYPQEVVVRLPSATTRIRKIQLLCHHYMIASRVDLAVGRLSSAASSLDHAHFSRLGYISLTDNKHTNFKSRELKSVNVDARGQLVRLTLHHNHINSLNLYNQVALVAVNVITDSTSPPTLKTHTPLQAVQQSDPLTLGAIHKPHISATDDLAFSMSQDPEIAEIIRGLYSDKSAAVREERYEYAKTLKQVTEELQKIGEVLCRYEVEKRCAVDREDYDTAKRKKLKSDTLRREVYKQLHSLHTYSQLSHHHHSHPSHPHLELPPVDTHTTAGSAGGRHPHSPHSSSPFLPPILSLPLHPSPKPPPQPYDERPLPALVKKTSQQNLDEEYPSPDRGGDVQEQLRRLTQKELAKVSNAVNVFGMDIVQRVFAKQFSVREVGLRQAHQLLSSLSSRPRGEMSVWLRGAAELVRATLKDSVFSCFSLSLDLLKYVMGTFYKKHKFDQQEMSMVLDKTFPILLERTGDSTPRIQNSAIDTVIEIARVDKVKSMATIGPRFLEPVKQSNWRLLRSQVELMSRLLSEVHTDCSGSGLSLEAVVKFLSPCLEHSNRLVRERAVKLTLDLYKQYGSNVCQWLPVQESSAERKKGFWKSLYDSFEQTDSHPHQRDFEVAKRAAVRQRDDTLHKLQAQTTALTSLTKKGTKLAKSELDEVLSVATASPLIHSSISLRAKRAEIEKMCMFCGERREQFTEEGLGTHYLTDCPMLHRCQYCTQAVEVSGLATHYLSECSQRERFRQCPRCRQAVPTSHYSSHTQAQHCVEVEEEGEEGGSGKVCPLCYGSVPSGETEWRSHLVNKCNKNTRRKSKPPALPRSNALPPRSPPNNT